MKIRLMGAELVLADRRTKITGLVLAFYNFAKAPKTVKYYLEKQTQLAVKTEQDTGIKRG